MIKKICCLGSCGYAPASVNYLKMDCLIRRSPRQVHTILDLDVFVQLHNLLFLPQIVPQAFFQNQVFYYDDYYLMMTYWWKNIEYLDIFTQNFWIEE